MRYYDLKNPTFEQWLNRGVYVAQCRTWKRANELCKDSAHLFHFHAKREYRDGYCKILRDMVALSIKMERFQKRLKK